MCSSLGEGTFRYLQTRTVCALSGSPGYALCVNNGCVCKYRGSHSHTEHTAGPRSFKNQTKPTNKIPARNDCGRGRVRSLSEVTLGTARYSLVLQQSGAGLDPVRFTNRKAGMFSR